MLEVTCMRRVLFIIVLLVMTSLSSLGISSANPQNDGSSNTITSSETWSEDGSLTCSMMDMRPTEPHCAGSAMELPRLHDERHKDDKTRTWEGARGSP